MTKLTPDSRPPAAFITMEGVDKIFRTPAGDFIALKDINVEFGEGEFVGVVGRSGCGKSTLVNMLTGIDRPSAGVVRMRGVDIHRLSESDMARWRGRNMGIVFQFFQLLPTLTLLENVLLPMDLAGKYAPDERIERAMDLLDMVGLAAHADDLPNAVAGGQQQSAAIARALANDPPIILADEPTGNLDSRAAEMVFGIFENLADQGKTIIMVTHDDALAARAKRVLRLSDGEIISDTGRDGGRGSRVQAKVA